MVTSYEWYSTVHRSNHVVCRKGHYEAPPYNNQTIRSAYHVREYEVSV